MKTEILSKLGKKINLIAPYKQVYHEEITLLRNFVSANKFLLWFAAALVLLTFGIKIVWFDYSIDTEVAMDNYGWLLHSWVTINRLGVVLIKKILFPHMFNPYLANFLTYTTLFLVVAALCLLFYRVTSTYSKKVSKTALVIFASLFVTSPILAEMFNFISLSFEICLGMLSVVAAIYAAFLYIEYKKVLLVILSFLLSSFAFSIYQALPAFYIASAASCLVLYAGLSSKNFRTKKFWEYALTFGVCFAASMAVYYSLPYLYHLLRGIPVAGNDYLSRQIQWGAMPASTILGNIRSAVATILFGHGYFYNHALLGGMILLAISFVVNYRRYELKRQISLGIGLLILLASPFLLIIVLGSSGVVRNNMPTLQLVTAFAYLYALITLKGKIIKILITATAFIFAYIQMLATSNILFLEHMKYEGDVALTTRIVTRLDQLGFNDYKDYNLVVVGSKASTIPHTVTYDNVLDRAFGVALDKSFYEWDTTSPVGVSNRVAGFMVSQGYPFKILDFSSAHDLSLAREWRARGQNLPVWPQNDSIAINTSQKVVVLHL